MKKMNILIVEDDPSDVELMKIALEHYKTPSQVHLCGDGEKALDFLRREPRPDLIILDLKLPKKDGHEVLREINDDKHLREIPVAVLTTSAQESDNEKARTYPKVKFFTKPDRFAEYKTLLDLIHDFSLTTH